MRPFEYVEASTVQETVNLLAESPEATQVIAGGSDLLGEIKLGLVSPRRLVGLSGISGLRGIAETADHVTIGAMTTIADIAAHPVIRSDFTALAEACAGLATPQIRNVGTLGGNLAQRPRCWYYRQPLTKCLKKGGDLCFALAGSSKYLCVTSGDRCYIVHPSDTAVALMCLGAEIEIAGPAGLRTVTTDDFFVGPAQDLNKENILGSGELVTRVSLPRPSGGRKSLYLKAGEREAGDFALVSVAGAVIIEGSVVVQAAVVLGGVAPVPYRAAQIGSYLQNREVSEVGLERVGSMALPDARPMAENGYKVLLAANLVKRAVKRLLEAG